MENQPIESIKSPEGNQHPIVPTEIKFKFYGLFTFAIIPFVWTMFYISLMTAFGGLFFIFLIIFYKFLQLFERSIQYDSVISKINRFIANTLYIALKITFGAKTTSNDPRQIRFTWFFLLGGPLALLVAIASYWVSLLIIPFIFIIAKRDLFLEKVFKLTLFPRAEYFTPVSDIEKTQKQIEEKKNKWDNYESIYHYQDQKEYFRFYPPNKITAIMGYLLIILIPIFLIILFNIITENSVNNAKLSLTLSKTSLNVLLIGYLGVLPYLLLSLHSKFKYPRYVSTNVAEFVVDTFTSDMLSVVPTFKGDYYFEKNSRVLDMDDTFGFFEIFKHGRIVTMFLLPLSLISYLFGWLIGDTQRNDLTAAIFIQKFNEAIFQGRFIFIVIFILPFFIAFILPLIWVLSDSEIKRANWSRDIDDDESLDQEIESVEDLGKAINRYFGLIIGISAITGLTGLIRNLVGETESTRDVYLIFFVILLFGAILILPGTMFMAYRYFASGDHARGVNYLRYKLSNSPRVGVGTISKHYNKTGALPPPKSKYILEQIGLQQEEPPAHSTN